MNCSYTTMKSSALRIASVGAILILASACSSSSKPQKIEGYDYRQIHKIKVTREQVSVSIVLPQQGTMLAPGDQRRFHIFLRDFIQRGRTAVTVESTRPQLAKKILLDNGLRENEIIMVSDTTIKAPNAVISFTANKTVAPECGDWSSDSGFNPLNKPHSNFGCSLQRNIGKIVADPGDFIQAQPSTGGAAERTDKSIRIHQSGAVMPRLLDSEKITP